MAGARAKTENNDPNPADLRAADPLDRDFTAPAPNRKWITDPTCVRTYQSFTYVAFIVDCFSEKIVSWHASIKWDVELVDVARRMALWRRPHEATPPDATSSSTTPTSGRNTPACASHLRIEGIRLQSAA
ncbi:DDE-type integrase/transposase/recombinase [Streptomyces sp. NPDC006283]|uniref:DDE-type integrase/transposase/recombinase n=1 Tax=Streptomyces sp. NPDC006283 TaxID=3156741 RepID=UPI0033B3EC15